MFSIVAGVTMDLVLVNRFILTWMWTSLTGQPLHKEEGSGTVLLLELFCWNVINISELAFSYARFMLCGDTLITAHGHALRLCAR